MRITDPSTSRGIDSLIERKTGAAPGATIVKCSRCDGTGRVCEAHIARPWDGAYACGCGAAGAPCGRCNQPAQGQIPRMPAGFRTEIDMDGWRHKFRNIRPLLNLLSDGNSRGAKMKFKTIALAGAFALASTFALAQSARGTGGAGPGGGSSNGSGVGNGSAAGASTPQTSTTTGAASNRSGMTDTSGAGGPNGTAGGSTSLSGTGSSRQGGQTPGPSDDKR
jgi:hypothetical protein